MMMMDSFGESGWDLLDFSYIEDATSADFFWTNQSLDDIDVSSIGVVSIEKRSKRKREQNDPSGKAAAKACHEKMRRDKMNDRFSDLCSILEPGRPPKADKSAILSDAIRVLHQLRIEARELKKKNEKLQRDIKTLKGEKKEIREEKLQLKATKENMEQQLKAMAVLPARFVHTHPMMYHTRANKTMTFSNYGGFPMWQWIPSAVLDTSQDHVLRPPVA